MMEKKIKKRRRPKVIVTQPRRLAAISLAQRVAKERLEVLGKSVGYRVARDSSTVDPETRCIFMTAGLLLQVNIQRVYVNYNALSGFRPRLCLKYNWRI